MYALPRNGSVSGGSLHLFSSRSVCGLRVALSSCLSRAAAVADAFVSFLTHLSCLSRADFLVILNTSELTQQSCFFLAAEQLMALEDIWACLYLCTYIYVCIYYIYIYIYIYIYSFFYCFFWAATQSWRQWQQWRCPAELVIVRVGVQLSWLLAQVVAS